MTLAYPRLSRMDAEPEMARIHDVYQQGGIPALEDLVQYDHERKQPVATGRIASAGEIAEMRERVLDSIGEWRGRARLTSPEDRAGFDNSLGVALHRHLNIVPSDTGHEGTWTFLTVLVFPDLAATRFENLAASRLVGTPRNVLRRVWQRQDVLGDLLQQGRVPLGEDELVGLFERTALVRNKALVREVVRAVYAYEGTRRSAWARKFYKLVTFQTGARMLDLLDADDLARLITSLAAQAADLSEEPTPASGDSN